MKDRVSTKVLQNGALRYGIYDEAGKLVRYEYIKPEDEPIEEGTLLNKKNLLSDLTAMAYGLPTSAVPDDVFRLITSMVTPPSGGGGEGGAFEDTACECGVFANTGAGWNSYRFREAFDAPPQVLLHAEDFEGTILIKDVTAEGFLYCLRLPLRAEDISISWAAGAVTKENVYVGQQEGSGGHNILKPVVTDVLFPSLASLDGIVTTTAEAVKIHYFAIEYGGER